MICSTSRAFTIFLGSFVFDHLNEPSSKSVRRFKSLVFCQEFAIVILRSKIRYIRILTVRFSFSSSNLTCVLPPGHPVRRHYETPPSSRSPQDCSHMCSLHISSFKKPTGLVRNFKTKECNLPEVIGGVLISTKTKVPGH